MKDIKLYLYPILIIVVVLTLIFLFKTFVWSSIHYARHGIPHSAAVTFRMGEMVRQEISRQLRVHARTVVLSPDDGRKNKAMRSSGWAILLDEYQEILRCRYEPVWNSRFSIWPERIIVSDCNHS